MTRNEATKTNKMTNESQKPTNSSPHNNYNDNNNHAAATPPSSRAHRVDVEKKNKIHFLHFNDVYNIDARAAPEPVGGAARFATLVDALRHTGVGVGKDNDHPMFRDPSRDPPPILVFSGDAFNPSLMSTVTKGVQMVPILNKLAVDISVFGNHDFDFGVEVLEDLASKNSFPWLLSNVYDKYTGSPLANGKTSHVIRVGGRQIAFVGLVEDAWMQTLATVDPEQLDYLDYVEEGRRLAIELRRQGAEVVVALTHMRWPNDRRLAREVDEIDIVLGGHDHDYGMETIKGRRHGKEVDKIVLKSGTDFRELSAITLHFGDDDDDLHFEVKKLTVDSSIPEDVETKEIVDFYGADLLKKMEEILGVIDVNLDGRFSSVRTMETNMGNFICDIMLAATDADFALLNSGTLRSDTLHSPGNFTRGHLTTILPFVDPIVVLRVSADDVIQSLENSVAKWPVHEGRFAQVAGIRFAFDPSLPVGNRVNPRFVQIQGNYLDLERKDYVMATKAYLAMGKDGYDCLSNCETLVDEETGPILRVIVENHFESVAIVRGEKTPRSKHRQPLLSRRSASFLSALPVEPSVVASAASAGGDDHLLGTKDDLGSPLRRARISRSKSLGGSLKKTTRPLLTKQKTVEEREKELAHLCPSVDGRIVVIDGPEVLEYLEDQRTIWEVKNNPTPLTELTEMEGDEGGWGDEGGGGGDC